MSKTKSFYDVVNKRSLIQKKYASGKAYLAEVHI